MTPTTLEEECYEAAAWMSGAHRIDRTLLDQDEPWDQYAEHPDTTDRDLEEAAELANLLLLQETMAGRV